MEGYFSTSYYVDNKNLSFTGMLQSSFDTFPSNYDVPMTSEFDCYLAAGVDNERLTVADIYDLIYSSLSQTPPVEGCQAWMTSQTPETCCQSTEIMPRVPGCGKCPNSTAVDLDDEYLIEELLGLEFELKAADAAAAADDDDGGVCGGCGSSLPLFYVDEPILTPPATPPRQYSHFPSHTGHYPPTAFGEFSPKYSPQYSPEYAVPHTRSPVFEEQHMSYMPCSPNSDSRDSSIPTTVDDLASDLEDDVDEEDMTSPGVSPNSSLDAVSSPTAPVRTVRRRRRKRQLLQFLLDTLNDDRHSPAIIEWVQRDKGVFRFVEPKQVAQLWGAKRRRPGMTYENLSRAMRYYYKAGVMQRAPEHGRLVYQFLPKRDS